METKAFWKTSEFWTMLFGQAGTFIGAISGVIPEEWSVIVGAILIFGYNLSRGMAKSGVLPEKKPEGTPNVENK